MMQKTNVREINIDPNMPQIEIAHTIMKVLRTDKARYVGILNSINLNVYSVIPFKGNIK